MPPPKKSFGSQKKDPAPPPAPALSKNSKGKGSGPDPGRSTPQPDGSAGDTPPTGPTVKQIIGGPSWTGKLPVNLLSEYCQKNGWDGKPDYSTRRFPDGFLGSVTLRCKNPKTRLVEEVVFTPPRQVKTATGEIARLHQPTPLEARHLLATYALNRVANMININFMLPPSHQDFWKIFEDNRKHDLKDGKSWMYESDPFQAQRERKLLLEKIEKSRLAREAEAAAGGSMVGGGRLGGGYWNERMKGWQNVPIAEMGKEMRAQVEDLIRKYHDWNPDGIEMSKEAKEKAMEELMNLGFRKSHVEEACDWVADRQECLGEWFCGGLCASRSLTSALKM